MVKGIAGLMVAGVFAAAGLAQAADTVQVDSEIPKYTKSTEAVSGSIKSVGSDSMNKLMTMWSDGFKAIYPNVTAEIEGKGSSTAPPAMINGQANFGPMSREWKSSEIAEFQKAFGYKPTVIPTSIDMLAVFVHKDNPLEGLTFQQIDAIFSSTRKGGATDEITTWGQLGLTGEWADQPISLYGRNTASGTYAYFKETALFGGDFKDSVKAQPGTAAVVQGVAGEKFGIGYGGIGYLTADVRAVPVSEEESAGFVAPEPEAAYDGSYPLSRDLYLSVNFKPGSKLDPLRREFLKYVLSQEGQAVVVKDGYLPLTAEDVEDALAQIGVKAAATASASTKTSAAKGTR